MRRRHAVPLLLTVLALGTASCGGDDEGAQTEPQRSDTVQATDTAPAGTTAGSEPGTAAVPQPDTVSGGTPANTTEAAPQTRPRTTTGGGAQAPSRSRTPATDEAGDDTPPPTDSPAGRFESFCDQNPGACD